MENYFLQEISFHHPDWSPVNLICTFIKRREYLSIKPIIKQFVLYLFIVEACFGHGTYLVPIQPRTGKNHTWYLSILVHHHIISACINTPTNAQICNKQQKIAKMGHDRSHFRVIYALKNTGLKKVHYCMNTWIHVDLVVIWWPFCDHLGTIRAYFGM